MIAFFARIVGRFGMNPKEAERFFKFMMVGAIGFTLDFGTLTVQVEVLELPAWIAASSMLTETMGLIMANTVSFTLAVLSNFTLNRYWTYPESRSKKKRVQLPQFTLVSVVGLLLNNGILAMLTAPFSQLLTGVHAPASIGGYIPAKIAATGVVLFWNFFINRYWTYGNVQWGEEMLNDSGQAG